MAWWIRLDAGERAVAVEQPCISRRGALASAVLLGAASCAVQPGPARAEGLPDEPYTAWPGYATTAPVAIVPGCVPVSAPLSGGVAWRFPADADGPVALRQIGSSTRAYALAGEAVVAIDAKTGERVAASDPFAPVSPCSQMLFIDSALAVPEAGGAVALYTEDLERIAASPAPSDGTAWGAAAVATDGAVLYAAFGAPGRVRVVGLSGYDAQELWAVEYEAEGNPPLPTLVALADGVAVVDGGPAVRLFSASDGAKRAEFNLGSPIGARVAPVYAGGHAESAGHARRCADAVLAGTSDGRLSLLRDRDGLMEDARLDVGRDLADCAPVAAARGGVWSADDAFIALDIQVSGEGARIDAVGEVPAASPVAARGVACCRGASLPAAEVTVYAVTEGGLQRIERAADGSCAVDTVCDASSVGGTPDPWCSAAPLVDRDGGLVLVGRSGDIIALEPDASRAVATDVGGHEGLDTVGAALSGIKLPNGVGIGAGALVLGGTFAAYALIRNRGGARDRDEGLDEWRARNDSREGEDGPGGRDF